MKNKRPWKKHARIERVETNNGDVKFRTFHEYDGLHGAKPDCYVHRATFEDLVSAEADLDVWFAEWWPQQIKRTRPA